MVVAIVLAGCGRNQQEARMPTNDEQQSIFGEIQAFSQAWSRGDARGAASFFTEDGVRVGAAGDVEHGREP